MKPITRSEDILHNYLAYTSICEKQGIAQLNTIEVLMNVLADIQMDKPSNLFNLMPGDIFDNDNEPLTELGRFLNKNGFMRSIHPAYLHGNNNAFWIKHNSSDDQMIYVALYYQNSREYISVNEVVLRDGMGIGDSLELTDMDFNSISNWLVEIISKIEIKLTGKSRVSI